MSPKQSGDRHAVVGRHGRHGQRLPVGPKIRRPSHPFGQVVVAGLLLPARAGQAVLAVSVSDDGRGDVSGDELTDISCGGKAGIEIVYVVIRARPGGERIKSRPEKANQAEIIRGVANLIIHLGAGVGDMQFGPS